MVAFNLNEGFDMLKLESTLANLDNMALHMSTNSQVCLFTESDNIWLE